MTPDALASHYLAHTGLHAVLALGTADGTRFRIVACAGDKLRKPPTGITLVGTWWARDEALAIRVVTFCYEIAAANGVERSRAWLTCPTHEAEGLIAAAASRLGTPLWADRLLRARALAAVNEIEADMERRRRSGALKSVNREYAEQRATALAKGERAPTYGDYVLALKRRALAEHARRAGELHSSPSLSSMV